MLSIKLRFVVSAKQFYQSKPSEAIPWPLGAIWGYLEKGLAIPSQANSEGLWSFTGKIPAGRGLRPTFYALHKTKVVDLMYAVTAYIHFYRLGQGGYYEFEPFQLSCYVQRLFDVLC